MLYTCERIIMNNISRRQFCGYVGACTSSLFLQDYIIAADSIFKSKCPNIILIMISDLGYGELGCYNNQDNNTPYIDALAVNGTRFTDFHSSGPVGSVTWSSVLTGLYPQRFGPAAAMASNHRCDEPLLTTTFLDLLKASGYQEKIITQTNHGSIDTLTRQSVDFIRQSETPFCLLISNSLSVDNNYSFKKRLKSIDQSIGEITSALMHLQNEQNTFIFFFSGGGSNRNINNSLRG